MSKKAAVEASESNQAQAVLEPAHQANQQLFEIRDLLFGDQLRAVHQRADAIEAKLQNKLQEMNSIFSTAMSALRDELNEQLSTHKQQSLNLHRQHEAQQASLREQIDGLSEQLQNTQQELTSADSRLQEQLKKELDQLSLTVQKNYSDLMLKLNAASEELSSNKADRKTLAALLASMADNLTNQA